MVKQATASNEAQASDAADSSVSKFLDAVWMERGLSANTLAAYRADLTALARWLTERGTPIIKTTRADLLGFIAFRVEAGARPRSTARQLSSFRRFFRYFVREGVIKDDPTAQIAMPKIGRSLPKSLTEEEVESLLGAPAISDPLGHRDRTMLEATLDRLRDPLSRLLGEDARAEVSAAVFPEDGLTSGALFSALDVNRDAMSLRPRGTSEPRVTQERTPAA